MKFKFLLVFIAMSLNACTGIVWQKDGVTEAEFNQDNSYCEMMRDMGTPVQPYSGGQAVSNTSGTINSTTGTSYYSGTTTTTYTNPHDYSGVAIALKGKRIYENCMMSKGYSEASQESLTPVDNDPPGKCKTHYGIIILTPTQCINSRGQVVE